MNIFEYQLAGISRVEKHWPKKTAATRTVLCQDASPCCVRTVSRTSCWFPSYSKRTSTRKSSKTSQEVCQSFTTPSQANRNDSENSTKLHTYLNSSSLLFSITSRETFPRKPNGNPLEASHENGNRHHLARLRRIWCSCVQRPWPGSLSVYGSKIPSENPALFLYVLILFLCRPSC